MQKVLHRMRGVIWPFITLAAVTAACAAAIYLLALPATPAPARDLGQWDGRPQAERDWYRDAELTAAARQRLNWIKCCDHADVVHTKFRVGAGGNDVWEWLDGTTWKVVPPDIIHWGEHAPGGAPTLFVFAATPTCFFPGDGGM